MEDWAEIRRLCRAEVMPIKAVFEDLATLFASFSSPGPGRPGSVEN